MKLALAVLGLAVLTAACTKVEAKLPPPDPPALAMPTPPDPILVPITLPDPPPPPAATPTPTPKPAPRTAAGSATPPIPTPTPTPTVAPEVPPPALQTSNSADLEAATQSLLLTAQGDVEKLASVNLSKGARDQYEIAKRMIDLSRAQLRVKNYLFAREMATRATSILSLLLKSRLPTALSPLPTAP